MRRFVFVMLVACGGAVTTGDDAAVTPDVAADSPIATEASADACADASVTVAAKCVVEAGALACDAGNGWAWGDAGIACVDQQCPNGATCYTLGAGSQSGVCE